MSKADGLLAAFPFVPLDAITFTRAVGFAMCVASFGVALPATRVAGSSLSGCLSLMGIWSQYKMGVPYWLPVVNTVLAIVIGVGT